MRCAGADGLAFARERHDAARHEAGDLDHDDALPVGVAISKALRSLSSLALSRSA